MPEREIRFIPKKEFRPGALYEAIEGAEPTELEEKTAELKKKKEHPFVLLCKKIYSISPNLGKGATYSPEFKEAIDFLGWDLKAEELNATVKFFLMIGLTVIVLLFMLLFFLPNVSELLGKIFGPMVLIYIIVLPTLIVFALANYINSFPISAAKDEEKKALTYVPEIVGYLVMSLKLVPNLEKAVEFAAEHGKGKIAEEFQQLLWNVQLGVYNTLAEGLDEMAYRWGSFSPEFKQALMRVRASVLEDSEAKRYALLDKTMEDILASIKEKMEDYARSLNQPSVMLFYLGILLPLILIIVLPIGSAFTSSPLAQPLILSGIYNVLIPLITLFVALRIIKTRPPTYVPPKISDEYPMLPKKWHLKLKQGSIDLRLIAAIILIIGLAFSYYISTNGFPPSFLVEGSPDAIEGIAVFPQILPKDQSMREVLEREGLCIGIECDTYFEEGGKKWNELLKELGNNKEEARAALALEKAQFFSRKETDVTPYNLIFGLLLTFSLIFFIVFKYRNFYKRKAQLEVMSLEAEFRDSLYVIASRLGENRPVEDALDYTRKFLPKYKISDRIYGKVLDNIKLLGFPLEAAVFDKKFGALVNVPSTIIYGGMKILVDAVRLGVNVGAKTLISLSLQLENSDKVTRLMKTLLSDITTMMNSMISLIAPVVLGITVTLQKIVLLTLASVVSSGITQQMSQFKFSPEGIGTNIPLGSITEQMGKTQLFSAQGFASIATPVQFLLIVAIYVLEITIILTYFTTKIEEDNELLFKMNLARNLPLALVVFIITVILSNTVLGAIGGI